MHIAEQRVNAQLDLAKMRRDLAADKPKEARKDPAAELLEMRRRLHGE